MAGRTKKASSRDKIENYTSEVGLRPDELPTNLYSNLIKNQPLLNLSSFRLAREVILAHALLMAAADMYLRPFDLSWSKLIILLWLRAYRDEHSQGLAPSTLSEMTGVSRNTVSTLLDGLEQQGYVVRELNQADKRRFIIDVTAQGAAVAERCLASLSTELEGILEPMDARQREILTNSLQQFQQAIINH